MFYKLYLFTQQNVFKYRIKGGGQNCVCINVLSRFRSCMHFSLKKVLLTNEVLTVFMTRFHTKLRHVTM